ncbi:hypothetical protein F4806DRAFT_481211 [Annulohypoxylon nitens]|nr:hypothetical protein F4806DRAFT_481211 [Annulohypoxylon nitens]
MRPPRRSRNAFFKRLMHRRVLRTPGRGFLQILQFYAVYYLHVCWKVLGYLMPELTIPISFMGIAGWGKSWIDRRSCLEPCDSMLRTQIAKYLSFCWYLFNMLAYIVFPALTLYNILYYELPWFDRIPESEGLSAIGQWGPIVGFVAALLTAYLARILLPHSPTNSRVKMENVNQDPFTRGTQLGAGSTPFGLICSEWKDLMEWWRDPYQFQ